VRIGVADLAKDEEPRAEIKHKVLHRNHLMEDLHARVLKQSGYGAAEAA
jgi:hypothetical protein